MKKIVTLFLVVSALSLTACGNATPVTTDDSVATPAVTNVPEATEQTEKLAFDLVAGELGEYGVPVTFNKGTDNEETITAYHIPAGEYTATNIGKYMTQLSIYSDETHTTESGYEEPAETILTKLIDVGATETFTIADGQYIELQEPASFRIEQK